MRCLKLFTRQWNPGEATAGERSPDHPQRLPRAGGAYSRRKLFLSCLFMLLKSAPCSSTLRFNVNPGLLNPWQINRGVSPFSGESSLLEGTPPNNDGFINPGSTLQAILFNNPVFPKDKNPSCHHTDGVCLISQASLTGLCRVELCPKASGLS